MAGFVTTSDGHRLGVYAEGDGPPIVFVHEFSGDQRAWAAQVAHFAPRFHCITYAARGYLPSDIPSDVAAYSQARAADDLAEVIVAACQGAAHVVGLSMGGYAALHLGLRRPELVRSLLIAGCGYGAAPDEHAGHAAASRAEADHAEAVGMAAYAQELAAGSHAQPLRTASYTAWAGYAARLAEHSVAGLAMTLRGVLATRPSLFAMAEELQGLACPVTLLMGDQDTPCSAANLFLHRTIPRCALCILPRTGHLANLEAPALFNRILGDSIKAADTIVEDMRR